MMAAVHCDHVPQLHAMGVYQNQQKLILSTAGGTERWWWWQLDGGAIAVLFARIVRIGAASAKREG